MTTDLADAADVLVAARVAAWDARDPDDRIEARHTYLTACAQFRERHCPDADYVFAACDLDGDNVRIYAVTGPESRLVWPADAG